MAFETIVKKLRAGGKGLTAAEKATYEANKAEIDALVAAKASLDLSTLVPPEMVRKTIRPNRANLFAAGATVQVIPDLSTAKYQTINYTNASGQPDTIGFVEVTCTTEKGRVAVQFSDALTLEEGVEYTAMVENVGKSGKRHVLSVAA